MIWPYLITDESPELLILQLFDFSMVCSLQLLERERRLVKLTSSSVGFVLASGMPFGVVIKVVRSGAFVIHPLIRSTR